MPARRSAMLWDWDEASRTVADAYFPHQLTLLGGGREPRVTLQTLDLGPVLIGHVGWGADVEIACDYPNAYEINMPLTGHLESHGRHGVVTSVVGQATIFRADTPSLISHWDATCTVLGVKFDRDWLDREAEKVLAAEPVCASGVLPEQLQLDRGAAREWRQLVGSLAAHLREPGLFHNSPAVREQLAGAISAGFLLASCPDLGDGPVARPRSISRVVDAIRDDPGRSWTAAEMAVVAGTSVRRMQEGFKEWIGCSPMDHLTSIRLQRARADLEAAPGSSVSEVAARWGFSSASRFAAAYRRRYGCTPSQAHR
ncbi:AraC family transcriptional regulator [Saccharopolyspora sp. WRP15-2]|uniref:AraC family transcriptional regulator n=1 Tax=Saccharopolyspora oryzae TaxID=2997343 RepID=A0ABT4V117_9PSEU|nr:AraC family transcriptional regulator [Saccharopolyspora oryzae]MDA3627637.1 AraC family transcriptional regulator [Saccharopolyspora oryzae]